MKFIRIEQPTRGGSFNFSRKIYHMIGLVIPIALYVELFDFLAPWFQFPTRSAGLLALIAFTITLLLVDALRFKVKAVNRLFVSIVGPLLKQEELKRYNATIPYFAACLILFIFSSTEVVMLSCIFLMIGDPVAAYTGGFYGRVRFWNNKSLEGMGAFIVAGFLGSLIFLAIHSYVDLTGNSSFHMTLADGALNWRMLLTVFCGVFCASLAEFFSSIRLHGLWDDNFIVPLCGAIGMSVTGQYLFQLPASALYFDPSLLF
ncbi:MAG: hypothetical protein KDK30_17320 [Leptospiraceae bacterium]|nr:hypothetical protein [Leptospiraceae bacterium]